MSASVCISMHPPTNPSIRSVARPSQQGGSLQANSSLAGRRLQAVLCVYVHRPADRPADRCSPPALPSPHSRNDVLSFSPRGILSPSCLGACVHHDACVCVGRAAVVRMDDRQTGEREHRAAAILFCSMVAWNQPACFAQLDGTD
mmetsp:Transcript_42557/g.106220  ORF Transcript_42557/g.106220 Transcript_42557/m.106220 type:complete len:145 (-) Transcript_42557:518-952(-)